MKSRSPAMRATSREDSHGTHGVRAGLLRAVPLRVESASLRRSLLRGLLSKAVFLRMAWLLPGLALLSSCSLDNELAPPVPNAAPDTRVGGQTPEPLESGFLVHLSWSGSDTDGEVVGYQFKLRPIGNDGIGYRDTLTVEPGSGAILNPWQFTATAESLFVMTPRDLPADTKLTQAYVFLIRAVDNAGSVDPTPAYVCFTASTLLPSIMVDRPPFYPYYDAQPVPPTVRFGFTGVDPDFHTGMPTKVRFLWKRALVDNNYIRTQYEYQLYYDELTSFADSNWSFWRPYHPDPEQRVITFPNTPSHDDQDRQITYIFAIQAMDTTGAVSVDRLYGYNVQNVYITEGLTPQLTVYEFSLGTVRGTGVNTVVAYDIAAQQPLNFSWVASAEPYFGTITAYLQANASTSVVAVYGIVFTFGIIPITLMILWTRFFAAHWPGISYGINKMNIGPQFCSNGGDHLVHMAVGVDLEHLRHFNTPCNSASSQIIPHEIHNHHVLCDLLFAVLQTVFQLLIPNLIFIPSYRTLNGLGNQ